MGFDALSEDGIARIAFSYGSANAMGTGFIEDLHAAIDAQRDARALVLIGRGKMFSAGLDLPALLSLDEAQVRRFIVGFSEVMERLFTLPIPTIAAVNGHAVAGGFVLASALDFRIAAAGPAQAGMTGVSLGVAYPSLVTAVLQYTLANTHWHSVLLEGRLFPIAELMPELVAADALEAAAMARAKTLCAGDLNAYARSKRLLKTATVEGARALADDSHNAFVKALFSPATRARLSAAAARLTAHRPSAHTKG